MKKNSSRSKSSPKVDCWTCLICGRTGFEKPTAHGCLNKPKDWKKSKVSASDQGSAFEDWEDDDGL